MVRSVGLELVRGDVSKKVKIYGQTADWSRWTDHVKSRSYRLRSTHLVCKGPLAQSVRAWC